MPHDEHKPEIPQNDHVSMEEIEAQDAVALPSKEVLSLLDVNANVDLGLDLAAPVDLAAAANLNVAAPIEAAASADVLSPGAEAIAAAHQSGTIDQTDSGTADAVAPQHAVVDQNSGTGATGGAAAPTDGTAAAGTHDAASTTAGTGTGGTVGGAVGAATGAVDGATSGATDGAVDGATSGATGAVDGATGATTGGVDSLLNGGSLLDANVDIHANANLAAPVDGAVAANGNVAAPIDAAVSANVGSQGAVSEAVAPQEVDIQQNLDHVQADATAQQDASVQQK